MKKPKKITWMDWPDTIQVRDGYDLKSIPDLTRNNFEYLIERYNELVEVINYLTEEILPSGIFDD